MGKDWTGDKESLFSTLGASNHSDGDREVNDYYATDPKCALDLQYSGLPTLLPIWEVACGEGHLSKQLKKMGYEVRESDIIDRGIGAEVIDFLSIPEEVKWFGNIVTNPPYKYAQEFIEKALDIIPDDCEVYMFLKLTFLEGQKRRKFFDKFPPVTVAVYSQRQVCAKNGDFDNAGSSAACYAWFVWRKGALPLPPVIKWI